MPQFQEARSPVVVEYSPEAVESIARLAVEGLLALPRIGMGVGGLLIGNGTPEAIHVSEAVPIPCSHSTGPSFALSPDELSLALEMARSASVVGFYYSRPRGLTAPTESEAELFLALCPDNGKVLVQIRPSTFEPPVAAVYRRNTSGVLTRIAEGALFATERAPEAPMPRAEPIPVRAPVLLLLEPQYGWRTWPVIGAFVRWFG